MRVIFSELARAGMVQLVEDESCRKSLEHSIIFYLRKEGKTNSRRCPAFEDRELFTYNLWVCRILFEMDENGIVVWTITRQSQG